MTMLETAKTYAYKKVWGEHSLTIGEVLSLALGVALVWFKFLGSWSLWVGLAVICLGMALF